MYFIPPVQSPVYKTYRGFIHIFVLYIHTVCILDINRHIEFPDVLSPLQSTFFLLYKSKSNNENDFVEFTAPKRTDLKNAEISIWTTRTPSKLAIDVIVYNWILILV